MTKTYRIMAVCILLAVLGGAYAIGHYGYESTDDAQVEAHVVSLSPRVAGYVAEVLTDANRGVKAGELLARIDPRDYQTALDRTNAGLKAAEAQLTAVTHGASSAQVMISSNVVTAQAQMEAAQAEWNRASSELHRLKQMTDASRSRSQLETAVAAEQGAHAALAQAQAKLKTAETAPDAVASVAAMVENLQAGVLKAKADVATAEKNLADTEIRAPFDGTVARRTAEKGAYAAPGQSLFLLVGTEYWVVANFKETQLARMHPGQTAELKLDAWPGKSLKGHVDSLQPGTGARFSLFPPENATGNFVKVVQRVPVKIVFDAPPGPEWRLGPGMSVEPTVNTR